ncbi:hypothetical protein ACWC0C_42000 [Streptomyces sp. NPDC001709]
MLPARTQVRLGAFLSITKPDAKLSREQLEQLAALGLEWTIRV